MDTRMGVATDTPQIAEPQIQGETQKEPAAQANVQQEEMDVSLYDLSLTGTPQTAEPQTQRVTRPERAD